MNPVIKLFRFLWWCWFFTSGFIIFMILFPAFFILLQNKKWWHIVLWLKRFTAKLIMFFSGIRVKIISQPSFNPKQAYVFCPNHSSYLDILVTLVIVPQYFHFMGKAELERVPLFNIFFKKMNIGVNRNSIMSAHKAYQRACDDIDKGISISIFPEATIPECAPQIGPFKNGAFKLAIEKQIPVVPITYLDNWKILPDNEKNRYSGRPGISRVIIHPPIETMGMGEKELKLLKERVREEMEKPLVKAEYIA